MANDAKQQLLDLLDRKVFDPILKADPDKYGKDDRKKLKEIQDKTRSTRKSYHDGYGSARAVEVNFRRDLHSDAAEKVHRSSRELGLPTFNDIKDEFVQLADRLGVK